MYILAELRPLSPASEDNSVNHWEGEARRTDIDNRNESTEIDTDNCLTHHEGRLSFCKKTNDCNNTENKPSHITGTILEGTRMVYSQHSLENIKLICRQEPFVCTLIDMDVISERRLAFSSLFTYKCKFRNIIRTLRTEDAEKKVEVLNVNSAAVSGMMSIGGGYSQLEELCGTRNMPCFSKETWKVNQDRIYNHGNLWELMAEASQEEVRRAIQAGSVDKKGRPRKSFVTDGAWPKKSYKTKYKSLSGVVSSNQMFVYRVVSSSKKRRRCCLSASEINIAQCAHVTLPQLRKVLFQLINVPKISQDRPPQWCKILSMHGLIYSRLIADGGSSVHRKLIGAIPYRPMKQVEKIECRNHICSYYSDKVRDACANIKFGNHELRSPHQALTCAIKYRKKF
ncbi:hypothetical protein PR048_016548 [Dryococelus australis]|uniref:Mutator-like transposase domain-containing protein n=1 Tax=Dryococelus australis TaxID=614101 RepID=A0ABQ9HK76_9NEOP|nr:hypothetical protein PR048_016548 [Dryococelus australis]